MMNCHRLVRTFSTLIVSRKRNPSFSQFTVPVKLAERNKNPNPIPLPHRTIPSFSQFIVPVKLGERNRNPNPIPLPHRTIPTMSIVTYAEKRAQRTNDEVIAVFESWLVRHGKSYNTLGEKERRFEIFKESLRFVDEHNADMNRSYRVGLNQFSDWTNEEYQSMCSGTKMPDQGGWDWNEDWNDGGTGFIIDNDGINTEKTTPHKERENYLKNAIKTRKMKRLFDAERKYNHPSYRDMFNFFYSLKR